MLHKNKVQYHYNMHEKITIRTPIKAAGMQSHWSHVLLIYLIELYEIKLKISQT